MIERSVRLEEEMYERLKEVADAETVPMSYLIRLAISRFLQTYTGTLIVMEVDK